MRVKNKIFTNQKRSRKITKQERYVPLYEFRVIQVPSLCSIEITIMSYVKFSLSHKMKVVM